MMRLWPWLEANKNRIIGVVAAVVVFAGVYSFMSWRHQEAELSAGEAFTQIMMAPPATPEQDAAAYEVLAAKYAGTMTAGRSLLQAASVLFEAGRFADAQAQFQKIVDTHAGGADLAVLAQLGVAASLEAQGKLDAAATAYEKVIAMSPGSTSAVPAEYAMGRIAEQQGKLESAESYFEQASRAGQAGGSLSQNAYSQAMEIKARLAAMQKMPAAATPTLSPTLSPSIPLSK